MISTAQKEEIIALHCKGTLMNNTLKCLYPQRGVGTLFEIMKFEKAFPILQNKPYDYISTLQ